MKIVGLIIILIAVPALIFWFSSGTRQKRLGYAAIGILPFVTGAWNLDAAIVNWAAWPGYTKGMVITLLDVLALAIVITHRIKWPPAAVLAPYCAYMALTLVSAFSADVWMASTFYTFQLLKGLLLMVAVCSIAMNRDGVRAIALGLAIAAIIEAGFTLSQKAGGAIAASGTMAHQNQLGMMLYFVLFPLIGLALGGDRRRVILVGILGGLIAIALGASRATTGLVGFGVVLLLLLSAMRHMTPVKLRLISLSIVVLVAAGGLAFTVLSKRLETHDTASSSAERAAFERAAHYMIEDHPTGVGANQYVVAANAGGYSQRAGVAWNAGSRATNVHNLYLLTAAEISWLGTIAIVALFFSAILAAMRYSWRDRKDPRGEFVLGLAVAMFTTALHNLYEWIFVTADVTAVFAIALGLIGGHIAGRQREIAQRQRLARKARALTQGGKSGDEEAAGEAAPGLGI